jgi:hypothetical protein
MLFSFTDCLLSNRNGVLSSHGAKNTSSFETPKRKRSCINNQMAGMDQESASYHGHDTLFITTKPITRTSPPAL